ncbi:MAG: TetR/AcrR family transcriptional regulator [Nocardioidaceae bacterium]|nr:TetR/AcrR family transcriptional regulator [Nocardioidaceae bacterium]
MARPSRRAERREQILAAAVSLIEQHDLATLRLTDVAAELDLTPNAVRYYFKDVDTLVLELAMRSDVRFYDERRAAAAALDDHRDKLSHLLGAGLPTGPEDAEWRAIWRAFLAAGFELDQRPEVAGIFHRQVGLYVEILDGGVADGVFSLTVPALDVATTLMSMEDYLGYRIVAKDPAFDRPRALHLMHGYAEMAVSAALPLPR